MNKIINNFKSKKGFTLQDLTIAILVLMLFAGTIGGLFISIYKVDLDTIVNSVATTYAIKMLEYMDKITYDKITEENKENLIQEMRQKFEIKDEYRIFLDISNYTTSWGTEDYIKQLKLTIKYSINNKEDYILFKTIKVKEL